MITKPTIRGIVAVAVFLTLSVTATSQGAFMTYNGLTLSQAVTIHDPSLSGGTLNTSAGQFSVTYQSVTRFAYCTEITQTAGSMEATELPVTTFSRYQLISYLMEQVAPAFTNSLAAQIQTAIWEAVFETSGTLSLTGGSFYIDQAGIATGANSLIAGFPGSYTPTATFRLTNPTRQDMLIVPEPMTLSLLGVGAAGTLLRRRRA